MDNVSFDSSGHNLRFRHVTSCCFNPCYLFHLVDLHPKYFSLPAINQSKIEMGNTIRNEQMITNVKIIL